MYKVRIKRVEDIKFVDNKITIQGITARVFKWWFQDVDLLTDIIKLVDHYLDVRMYWVLVDVEEEYSIVLVMLDVGISEGGG